jgi:hypothetical protein
LTHASARPDSGSNALDYRQTLIAPGLGSLITTATAAGNFPLLAAGVLTMALAIVALNRLVWRRVYRIADQRFSLKPLTYTGRSADGCRAAIAQCQKRGDAPTHRERSAQGRIACGLEMDAIAFAGHATTGRRAGSRSAPHCCCAGLIPPAHCARFPAAATATATIQWRSTR